MAIKYEELMEILEAIKKEDQNQSSSCESSSKNLALEAL
ncbi:Uncharacterised protein [Streptococcus pneumoniae]|nr:Uncharacterised protein [Streptococcus pneumoniae]